MCCSPRDSKDLDTAEWLTNNKTLWRLRPGLSCSLLHSQPLTTCLAPSGNSFIRVYTWGINGCIILPIYVWLRGISHEEVSPCKTDTQILFSHKKKKKILPFGTIWIDLEGTMLSEIVVQRKINTLWSHLHVKSKNTKLTENKSRMGAAGVWGLGKMLVKITSFQL